MLRTSRFRLQPHWRQKNASRGIAATEFGLLAPAVVSLMMGGHDIGAGWIAWRQTASAADSIGEIATLLAAGANGTNQLTPTSAWQAATALYAVNPQTLTLPASRYSVVLSEVTFSGCPGKCVANVAWSAVQIGTASPRPCGQLSAVPDGNTPTPTTLPQDLFQPLPVLVVDVTFVFEPLFANVITGPLTMARTTYEASRTGTSAITYTQTANVCS